MSLSPVTRSVDSSASTSGAKRSTSLSQEDFLKLFITQMQNQNPLEPMDNYQMATQMAQFSSLETLNNINQSLKGLTAYQASMNSLNTAGLIGKKVETTGNQLLVEKGAVSEGGYQLSKPGKVTLRVFDSNQQLVRVMEAGTKDVSKQKFTWDGKDQKGAALADGTYTFEVSAVDEKGLPIQTQSWMTGTVTGITFENGVTYLTVGSKRITLSDILAIQA
jgi:flagellar basal-body rod modification protein FlgD